MNKPRIKVGLSLDCRRRWMCFGSGAVGHGDTPKLAYQAWLRCAQFYKFVA